MTGYIQPKAGCVQPVVSDDLDEEPSRRDVARMKRVRERTELQEVLGVLFINTTLLPLVGGGFLGPARDRNGDVLRWALWAPHRAVLIDSFARIEPPKEEKEDRQAFAEANGLIYAAVGRDMVLTAKSAKELLDERRNHPA